MIGIYRITNPVGNVYVGQTKNFEKRIISYSRKNCKSQTKIYNSILKYGWENHSMILVEECDIDSLNEKEIYYINRFNSLDRIKGLNLKSGGSNGVLTEDGIKRMTEKLKQRHINNPSVLIELNKKSVEKTKGVKRTKEVIDKIKNGKIRNGTIRMKQSSIDKMKKTINERFKNDPSFLERMKKNRELSSGNIKSVICTKTWKEWSSCKDMCLEMGLDVKYTRKQLSGSRKNFTSYIYKEKN